MIVDSGYTFVNYHAIEISSSLSNSGASAVRRASKQSLVVNMASGVAKQ